MTKTEQTLPLIDAEIAVKLSVVLDELSRLRIGARDTVDTHLVEAVRAITSAIHAALTINKP